MVLLDKLWDDVLAGPHPDRGLGKLRKISTQIPPTSPKEGGGGGESSGGSAAASVKLQRSISIPGTPTTPVTPSTPSPRAKENVWRSVFHPGSNLATKGIGAEIFDKPQPNSPTIYDWLYSGETKSSHR
ncbi:unnamed protein product [Spirodela intermedia]|uniref:Uncharacterized protein n=2 Tax=Spirodela intermedia TaxID=51605 RepID=A0A7I8IK76_SPIIN|nr:unnamed protein product [Spirodela intermedia]CAA6658160.1 unnamed protein product [Spirodela intermedia]CAA7394322.1 unnamed protein product [Spirodela intermedia]